jgi:hypothetical protein
MHRVSVDGIMRSVERDVSSAPEPVGRRGMLRTQMCDLLGIEAPIMQAAIWPATASELVAAVSEAGGLAYGPSAACNFGERLSSTHLAE